MTTLLTALERNDKEKCDRIIYRISADGWREYLRSVNKNDTRAFFAYLAKAEGRKQQGFVPADASPMIDERGNMVLTPHEKVELISRTFSRRFAAPAVTNPSLPAQNPDNVPLRLFRNEEMGQHRPIRLQEMLLAIAHFPNGKAPGPDGFPVEIYKRLNTLHPYILTLLDAI